MGAPVLVGAGIGALSSLATGQDPLKGAALGGITGGAFGGSTGFGSGFTEGGLMDLGSSALSSVPEIATEGVAQSAMTAGAPSSLLSSQGADMALNPLNQGASLLSSSGGPVTATQSGFQAASPMNLTDSTGVVDNAIINPSTYSGGLDTSGASGLEVGGGYIPDPTVSNKVESLTKPVETGFFDDLGSSAYDSLANMSAMEQVQLGQMGLDAFTPEEQQAVQTQLAQITPAKKVTVGTPLAINTRPRTFKPRFA